MAAIQHCSHMYHLLDVLIYTHYRWITFLAKRTTRVSIPKKMNHTFIHSYMNKEKHSRIGTVRIVVNLCSYFNIGSVSLAILPR